MFFCVLKLAAQNDTTRVEYSEESEHTSDFSLKETYNYLIRAQVEERSMFKIAINNFGFGSEGSFLTYGIAYEQKITPAVSYMAEIKHIVSNAKYFIPSYSLNVGTRFYYNINNRIRKVKSANNFSANYIGLHQQNFLTRINDSFQYSPALQLVYGLQRRLGKYGFIDLHIGPGLQHVNGKSQIYLHSGFSIGFAL